MHFVVLSAHAQDPVYLPKYARESIMRNPLYAVRRSLRLQERESIDDFLYQGYLDPGYYTGVFLCYNNFKID